MNIETKDIFNNWKRYTLTNDHGMKVSFLDFGGIITEILVPDKNGVFENVVLAFKDEADYLNNGSYFGAITGRVAGRIAGASFTIDGNTYTLEANDGANHLHGGTKGFHQVLWKGEPFQTEDTVGVRLSHTSPDGDGGYPGTLEVTVTYTLNNDNEFRIHYEATSDKTTPLTITNHSYFNLTGNLKDTIVNHTLTLASDQFVELDEYLIPTGKLLDVEGTTFDFRQGRKIADGMNSDFEQNKIADNGYDHYFIFNDQSGDQVKVKDEESGRTLAVQTNQPGIVLYTGNMVAKGLALAEGESKPYLGLCLETQGSPASLHHDGFPDIILQANEKYDKETIFKFGVEA